MLSDLSEPFGITDSMPAVSGRHRSYPAFVRVLRLNSLATLKRIFPEYCTAGNQYKNSVLQIQVKRGIRELTVIGSKAIIQS